jgi:hypothetical protein
VDANGDAAFTVVTGERYVVRKATRKVVSLVVNATAGQFKVTIDGAQTADQAFNVTAVNLKTALEGLSTVGAGNILVTGGPGDGTGSAPYVITFDEVLAASNLALSAVNGTTPLSGGAATVVPTVTTAPALSDILLRLRGGFPTGPVSPHPVARRASGSYYPGV